MTSRVRRESESVDGLELIGDLQKRIRLLAGRCEDLTRQPDLLEEPLTAFLVELHLAVALETELLLPALDAIAGEVGSDEPSELRRNHRELKARLVAVSLAEATGTNAGDALWRGLLHAAVDHAKTHEETFLPVAARWLDSDVRTRLGALLSARRVELRKQIEDALG